MLSTRHFYYSLTYFLASLLTSCGGSSFSGGSPQVKKQTSDAVSSSIDINIIYENETGLAENALVAFKVDLVGGPNCWDKQTSPLSGTSGSPIKVKKDAAGCALFVKELSFLEAGATITLANVDGLSSESLDVKNFADTMNSANILVKVKQKFVTTHTSQLILSGHTPKVTIDPVVVLSSISVTPSVDTIDFNATRQFTATGYYSNGTTLDITNQASWSAANTSIAQSQSQLGLFKGISDGTTTITASLNGLSGSAQLSVRPQVQINVVLSSISVTPSVDTIDFNATRQFTATGYYSNGTTLDITNQASWSAVDTAIAQSQSQLGLFKGIGAGTTTITASLNGLSGSAQLTVKEICQGPVQTYAQTLHFDETPWGTCTGGTNTHSFTKVREELKALTLPSNLGTVCNAKVSIPDTSFEYDDEFLIAYDNTILVSSYYDPAADSWQSLNSTSTQYKNLYNYSWSYVSSLYYDWNSSTSHKYCAAPLIRDITQCNALSGAAKTSCLNGTKLQAKSCLMPGGSGATTIKRGQLEIDLHSDAAHMIFERTASNPTHSMKMVTYGNGVTSGQGDCYHSAFDLVFHLTYANQ